MGGTSKLTVDLTNFPSGVAASIYIAQATSWSVGSGFPPANISYIAQGSNTAAVGYDTTSPPNHRVYVNLNGGSGVTPVTIGDFAANADGAGVLVSWNAFTEFQNAGFNLYRCELAGSEWTRVNAALIAGRISNADLKTYRVYDWAAPGIYQYKLESVSVAGMRETYGEVTGLVTVGEVANAATDDGQTAAVASLIASENSVRTQELSAAFASAAAEANGGAAGSVRVAQAAAIASKPDGSLYSAA